MKSIFFEIFKNKPLFGLFCLVATLGCERPTTLDSIPQRKFEGQTLTIALSDPADQEFIRSYAQSWASRSGAKIAFVDQLDRNADVGIIRTGELGNLAEKGAILPTPKEILTSEHAYHWEDLFVVYSKRLMRWKDSPYALPVRGEGMVMVYRADALGPKTEPPETWNQVLDLAKKLGPGSFSPLPNQEFLLAQFCLIAACYDRLADLTLKPGTKLDDEFFSFFFDYKTGAPRLNSPGFIDAAAILNQLQAYRSTESLAAGFNSGKIKIGFLSLRELATFSNECPHQLIVAPLPGSNHAYEAKTGKLVALEKNISNRVPVFGWGGRLGVVPKTAPSADMAWDFLVDIGLGDRNSAEIIGDIRFGAGPYRFSHLDTRGKPRWVAYGVSSNNNEPISSALRDNLGSSVQNYRLGLRTPRADEFNRILAQQLTEMLKGKQDPIAALTKANAEWKTIVSSYPPNQWQLLHRASLGVN